MKWLVAQQQTTRCVRYGHVHRASAATAPTICEVEACPRLQRLDEPPARGEDSTGCDVTGLDLPWCTAPLSPERRVTLCDALSLLRAPRPTPTPRHLFRIFLAEFGILQA
jgi:hypothetical protein